MLKSNKYYTLMWSVECMNPNHAWFEPIAAFNVDSVAVRYAIDCKKANPYNTYRVMMRGAKGWEQSGRDL